VIGWQPYELDISSLVKEGRNEVEVRVCGSLKNLLGPHHGKLTPGMMTPFDWRHYPPHTPAGKDYDSYGYGLFEDFQVSASARR